MSEDWKIQISPKIGPVLSNFRGETWDEIKAQLIAVDWHLVAAAQADGEAAYELARAGLTGTATTIPAPGPSVNYPDVPTSAAPQAAPAGPARPADAACMHGPYVYSEFRSKAGKDLKVWKCSADTGPNTTQCVPKWVR